MEKSHCISPYIVKIDLYDWLFCDFPSLLKLHFHSRSSLESEKTLDRAFIGLTLAFAIGIGVILLTIATVVFLRSLPAIQAYGSVF